MINGSYEYYQPRVKFRDKSTCTISQDTVFQRLYLFPKTYLQLLEPEQN